MNILDGCRWKWKIVWKEVGKMNGEKVESCNRIKTDITGAFGVQSENKDGKRMLKLCAERERESCVWVNRISSSSIYTIKLG